MNPTPIAAAIALCVATPTAVLIYNLFAMLGDVLRVTT